MKITIKHMYVLEKCYFDINLILKNILNGHILINCILNFMKKKKKTLFPSVHLN